MSQKATFGTEEVFLYACSACDTVRLSSFPRDKYGKEYCPVCKNEQAIQPLTVEPNGMITAPRE